MDQYLDSRKDQIFRHVHTLIYIFDVISTNAADMVYFMDILGALRAGSGPSNGDISPDISAGASGPASGGSGSTSGGPVLHVLVSSKARSTSEHHLWALIWHAASV